MSLFSLVFPFIIMSAGAEDRCWLVKDSPSVSTYIVNGTDRAVTKHNDAVLLANGAWLQLVSGWSIERLRRSGHVRNVFDALLDDLSSSGKRERERERKRDDKRDK